MNFNSKKTLIVFFSLAAVAVSAPCFAGQRQQQSKLDDSWSSNISDARLELFEGTYKGQGDPTEHTYLLHLMHYLNQKASFIGVSEDLDTGRTTVGFVEREDEGVYDFYGVHVDRTSRVDILEPSLEEAPLFRFTVETDPKSSDKNALRHIF